MVARRAEPMSPEWGCAKADDIIDGSDMKTQINIITDPAAVASNEVEEYHTPQHLSLKQGAGT